MSYFMMAFFGAPPFGALLSGMLANRIGAPDTVVFTGACCLGGTLWFLNELPMVRAEMRPIYREKGILPPEREVELILDEPEAPM
jgi:hypothetical protein